MSASVRLMIQGHSARRVTSRVRQCHQLIKISEIKSEAYTRVFDCRASPSENAMSLKRLKRGKPLWDAMYMDLRVRPGWSHPFK